MSYCSRSCRRRFTVLNFKTWAFSRICGHCQQHFTAHAQERGYLGTSGKSFGDLATFSFDFFAFYMLNVIRFSNPDFLTKCEISAIWRYFPLIFFAFYKLKVRRISTSVLFYLYCTKFEVDMATHCQVIAFLLLIRCVTLWPWPALIHGGSRGQHRQKVRRSYAYPFLSYEL